MWRVLLFDHALQYPALQLFVIEFIHFIDLLYLKPTYKNVKK